jgi:tetratricopeptide (TPR) repeat protein
VLGSRIPTRLRAAVVVSAVILAGAARAQGPGAAPAPAEAATSPAAPEAAARPLDVEVERHAALGQRLLERGHTQEAIAEFRRAYELRDDARFLFDIADCYRRLGLRDQARFFYERYLAAAPEAPDRDEAEAALAAVGRADAPVPGAPAPTPTAPAPTPTFARDVVIVPLPLPLPVGPETGGARPLWRRWWAWTAFAVVVAASVATVLATRQNDTPVPATALGDQRFF